MAVKDIDKKLALINNPEVKVEQIYFNLKTGEINEICAIIPEEIFKEMKEVFGFDKEPKLSPYNRPSNIGVLYKDIALYKSKGRIFVAK